MFDLSTSRGRRSEHKLFLAQRSAGYARLPSRGDPTLKIAVSVQEMPGSITKYKEAYHSGAIEQSVMDNSCRSRYRFQAKFDAFRIENECWKLLTILGENKNYDLYS